MYCSPFDEALATRGPAAIFLVDPEGALRFDPRWTRDCWGRAPGPHPIDPRWLLLRDRGNGWVTLLFCSAVTLLAEHPRLEIRAFVDEADARRVHAALGVPPVDHEPW